MLSTIKLENSKSGNLDDRKKIFDLIRSTIGFYKLNSILFERLRRWMIEITKSKLDENVQSRDLNVVQALGLIYKHQSSYALARPLLEECVRERINKLGCFHEDTLYAQNNLAILYQDQGEFQSAQSLFEHCLEVRKRIWGEHHPNTIIIKSNLARLFIAQGLYDVAEKMLEECVNSHMETSGENHENTLSAKSSLASLFPLRNCTWKFYLFGNEL